MSAAWFYHLTRKPLQEALPVLLTKARQAGWRVAVRGPDRGRLEWLDEKLWLGPDDGFLPHGIDGGRHDAAQPILLTDAREAANNPDCLMTIDGAEVSAEEVAGYERVFILFDGTDVEAVQRARVQWKTLTDAGCSAQYWSEESGRWEKKAEK